MGKKTDDNKLPEHGVGQPPAIRGYLQKWGGLAITDPKDLPPTPRTLVLLTSISTVGVVLLAFRGAPMFAYPFVAIPATIAVLLVVRREKHVCRK